MEGGAVANGNREGRREKKSMRECSLRSFQDKAKSHRDCSLLSPLLCAKY